MGNAKIFSTLDLTRGFWQIPLKENAKQYCAFRTCRGLMEWSVMPFGLINSTATFTKMMRKILPSNKNILHYVDDISIFSNDWQSHLIPLEEVFKTLKQNKLTVTPSKVKIGLNEIEFLGHKFSNGHIEPTDQFNNKIL